jgi:hypothetical protein
MTDLTGRDNRRDVHGLTSAIPGELEDRQVFRLAQMTLLLEVAGEAGVPVRTIDRLGVYDFFSANPFIVVGEDERDRADRVRLRLAGFSDRQLSYASTGQRFTSRRRRLQHDLSLLLAYHIVALGPRGYVLTAEGRSIAEGLTSIYAEGYRQAAAMVLRRLGRLSDRRLNQQVDGWLGKSYLLLDLLDDVTETTPTTTRVTGRRRRA